MSLTTPMLPFLPDWANGVRVRYKFRTAISWTRRQHEQRKSLLLKPRREMHYSFLLQTDQAERFWNFLVSVQAEYFLVPVVSEPIMTTDASTPYYAGNELYPVESTLQHFNFLNFFNATYGGTGVVGLYDLRQQTEAQAHVATSVVHQGGDILTTLGDRIVMVAPGLLPIEEFAKATTVIYPMLMCIMLEKGRKYITDQTCSFVLRVDERLNPDVT